MDSQKLLSSLAGNRLNHTHPWLFKIALEIDNHRLTDLGLIVDSKIYIKPVIFITFVK